MGGCAAGTFIKQLGKIVPETLPEAMLVLRLFVASPYENSHGTRLHRATQLGNDKSRSSNPSKMIEWKYFYIQSSPFSETVLLFEGPQLPPFVFLIKAV
jgi:hypothetical protein